MASLVELVGFLLVVFGVGLMSVPCAVVVVGIGLIVAANFHPGGKKEGADANTR